MINFCTLFDSNYINYGLTLYKSLLKHCDDFHLYIFAFDDKCEEELKKRSLKNVTVISLAEFEDEKLLAIKDDRSKGEYCWTCTPSVILYAIKKFQLESCTYLDADLYFFSNPKPLIDELGDKSVSIIEHRYTPKYDHSEISGKYCVQFMTFKNNKQGLEVLNWWRDRCIEWCYSIPEDGKFGDQKYLDDWTTRFECVKELQNIGGGVAPWNINNYELDSKDDVIYVKEGAREDKLIFYHLHGFSLVNDKKVKLTGDYFISKLAKELVYKDYLQNFIKAGEIKYVKPNIVKRLFVLLRRIYKETTKTRSSSCYIYEIL